MTGWKLNEDQRLILQRMARERGEGHMLAVWIAESCGHAYDTPWASSRLPTLAKRGLVERLARGWWKITDGGRAALAAEERGEQASTSPPSEDRR